MVSFFTKEQLNAVYWRMELALYRAPYSAVDFNIKS